MHVNQHSVLVVDDDEALRELVTEQLIKRGYRAEAVSSAERALETLRVVDFGVVLTDVNMAGCSGLELCERILATREDVPVVVMTAFGTMEAAVAAVRAGAYDFLSKPFEFDALTLVLERALKLKALRSELSDLRVRVAASSREDLDIIGDSAPMRRMIDLIGRVAESDATVLIHGESGTGKELVANSIHQRSTRNHGPLVAINCAAMPETLLESELFGHAKGAFTDARSARSGLLVKANNGTLFLDEIAEMPGGMQAKLLRALQEKKVRPVGGDAEIAFDARIIAASHRDLEVEVEGGRFREDLFYRINVVRVDVPPLRARGSDILRLAAYFLKRYAGAARKLDSFTPAVAERFLTYPWPGNVRELQNCIERASALAQGTEVALEDLPPKIQHYRVQRVEIQSSGTADPRSMPPMDEIEARYIRQVLDAVSGNKGVAAEILGFDRRTLYRKLARIQKAADSAQRSEGQN